MEVWAQAVGLGTRLYLAGKCCRYFHRAFGATTTSHMHTLYSPAATAATAFTGPAAAAAAATATGPLTFDTPMFMCCWCCWCCWCWCCYCCCLHRPSCYCCCYCHRSPAPWCTSAHLLLLLLLLLLPQVLGGQRHPHLCPLVADAIRGRWQWQQQHALCPPLPPHRRRLWQPLLCPLLPPVRLILR